MEIRPHPNLLNPQRPQALQLHQQANRCIIDSRIGLA